MQQSFMEEVEQMLEDDRRQQLAPHQANVALTMYCFAAGVAVVLAVAILLFAKAM